MQGMPTAYTLNFTADNEIEFTNELVEEAYEPLEEDGTWEE